MPQISINATLRELARARRLLPKYARSNGGQAAAASIRRLLGRAEAAIISGDPELLQHAYDELRSLK